MRRCSPIKIGELWNSFRHDNPRVDYKLKLGRIPDTWRKTVGKNIAAMTNRIEMKGFILHISVSSAIVRHELFLHRKSLIETMNKELGADIIKDIFIH